MKQLIEETSNIATLKTDILNSKTNAETIDAAMVMVQVLGITVVDYVNELLPEKFNEVSNRVAQSISRQLSNMEDVNLYSINERTYIDKYILSIRFPKKEVMHIAQSSICEKYFNLKNKEGSK